MPRVVLAQLTPSEPTVDSKTDPKVEATASLVPERIEEPDRESRPINPDKPVAPAKPRDLWRDGLDQLRSVARDHANESGGGADGVWALRTRLLDWLEEPEGLAMSEEGSLRRSILSTLVATTGPEPAGASTQATTIHDAVAALEARAPLEITELQLCRKVKGFGEFEPLEAAACRPGHSVIVYCEMAGLRYELEGPLHRSRLASRVEVVASGGGEPLWTQPLGTADDLCHRRRRDYYVNYRITLPESLAPGSYELRLVQDDLVANHTATRAVSFVLQP
jgi:hypothetical protein